MKKSMIMLIFLLGLVFQPFSSFALELTTAVISSGIQDRAPQVVADSFLSSIGKVYCFSHILGANNETSIWHVWYWEGQEMARVRLPVRSSSWRTWSSKKLNPDWTGAWEVKVLDEQENLLGSVPFRIE